MSTIKVNKIENTATASGGIAIDASGNVQIDGVQLPNAGQLSHRNRVINGRMLVNQRGNRAASGFSAAFYAGPDRWLVNRSGTGDTGFSQIDSTDFGGTKAAEATFLAAASETYIVSQRIESSNIADLAGQNVTLSFYAKGANSAGSATLNVSLSHATAVDNFASETVIATHSVSYTASAQLFTFTFTLPSGAANGVAVRFSGEKQTATGTFTFTYGGVQLEAGNKATALEQRSINDELRNCKRYYQANDSNFYFSANVGSAMVNVFSEEMRATPTMTQVSGSGNFNSFSDIGKTNCSMTIGGSGDNYFSIKWKAEAEL